MANLKKIVGGHKYEIVESEDSELYANGNICKVNGKPVGSTEFFTINSKLKIIVLNLNSNYGDHRGNGYGTIFLKMIEQHAKEQGCKEAYAIDVDDDGKWFFPCMGYEQTGEKKSTYHKILK